MIEPNTILYNSEQLKIPLSYSKDIYSPLAYTLQ